MKSVRSVQGVDVVHGHHEIISLMYFNNINSTKLQVLIDGEEESNRVELHNIITYINLLVFMVY